MDNLFIAGEKRKKAARLLWMADGVPHWREAVPLLEEAAEMGDTHAYYFLGRCYCENRAGSGAPSNREKGERLLAEGASLGCTMCVLYLHCLNKTCGGAPVSLRDALSDVMDEAVRGDPFACLLLGEAYLSDSLAVLASLPDSMNGQEKHAVWRGEAARWFLRSCRAGVVSALGGLAMIRLEEGKHRQADALARAAAERGDALGCLLAAAQRLSASGGGDENAKAAVHFLKRGVLQYSSACAMRLARIYFYGESGFKENDLKARVYFSIALRCGDYDSWYYLGKMYHYGHGVAKDKAAAAACYRKAQESGGSCAEIAAFELKRLLRDTPGKPPAPGNARRWERFRLSGGYTYFMLGLYYRRSPGQSLNVIKSILCFQRAADAGCAQAALELGRMFYFGRGPAADPVRAQDAFERAAELGSRTAWYFLGEISRFGMSKFPDMGRAAECYQKAAGGDDGSACLELGKILFLGLDGNEDNASARGYLLRAARRKHGEAWYYLGEIYRGGYGVEANPNRAARCYRKVPPGPLRGEAAYRLGCLYDAGARGIRKNIKKARRFYEESARYPGTKEAERWSLYALGRIYERGEGVAPDCTKAAGYYSKSARLGCAEAARALPGCLNQAINGENAHRPVRRGWRAWAAGILRRLGLGYR